MYAAPYRPLIGGCAWSAIIDTPAHDKHMPRTDNLIHARSHDCDIVSTYNAKQALTNRRRSQAHTTPMTMGSVKW